jgi:uncharacterized protein YjbJ (UPF0337 family)
MHSDTFSGRWDQLRRDVQREWSRLTDEDLDQIKGNMDELVSLLQEKYDYTRDEAQHEVTRFLDSHDNRAVQIVRQMPSDMDKELHRHPWAAVAAAIGFGIALGLLVVRPGHAS